MCEPTTIASLAIELGASAGTASTIGTVGSAAALVGSAAYSASVMRRAGKPQATPLLTPPAPAAEAYRSPEDAAGDAFAATSRKNLKINLATPALGAGLQVKTNGR